MNNIAAISLQTYKHCSLPAMYMCQSNSVILTYAQLVNFITRIVINHLMMIT